MLGILHCFLLFFQILFYINQKLIEVSFISDKPGNHNFELLKKLVLPDGSVLRAQLPGRPTLDCLFADPARDGKRSFFCFIPTFLVNHSCYAVKFLTLMFLQSA